MIRTLAILIVAGALAPTTVFASSANNNNKSNGAAKGGSGSTAVAKPGNVTANAKSGTPAKGTTKGTTTNKGNVDAAKKLPKVNNGYQPKVAKNTHDKYINKNFDKNYHLRCGTKFDYGYCYHGFNHCHWSYCCFDRYLGCYTYWCPCTCSYYYYCQPYECFYPVTYCPCQTYVFVNVTVVPGIAVVPTEGVSPQ